MRDASVTDPSVMDKSRELLRHAVAALAYRATRAISDAPEEFGRLEGYGRPPVKILAHMGDLFDWALGMCDGQHRWHDSAPLAWDAEVARFFAALEAFDKRLGSGEPLGFPAEKLFQGPIADALTHVGQIAMLRRLAGCKMRGENYVAAKIETGRVGAEQAAAAIEFD